MQKKIYAVVVSETASGIVYVEAEHLGEADKKIRKFFLGDMSSDYFVNSSGYRIDDISSVKNPNQEI